MVFLSVDCAENETASSPPEEGSGLPPPPRGRVGQTVVATLLILLIITVLFLRLLVFTPFVVLLDSMEPTIRSDDHVLVNRRAYRQQLPQRGDIILFRGPGENAVLLAKRILGVPGDYLAVAKGYVWRNGARLDEQAYTLQDPLKVDPELRFIQVPPNTVFVLGDNRNRSEDSRDYGPVPVSEIVGRAELIFWPLSRWERLRVPPTATDPTEGRQL